MLLRVETHHQKAPSAVVFNALHTDQKMLKMNFGVSERKNPKLSLYRQYDCEQHLERSKKKF